MYCNPLSIQPQYPRYPDIENLSVSESERSLLLDLRPYMDTAPFTIRQQASLQRSYRMFRTLGLRHLIVVNIQNIVLGIITRKDLAHVHTRRTTTTDKRRQGKMRFDIDLHDNSLM